MRGDFTARSHLTDFVVLYVLLYGAFGAASPFLPAYIGERGIPAELIGVVFGAGTAIRLISAPIAGRIADRTHALRLVLAVWAVGTALGATGYLAAGSFWPLLAVSLSENPASGKPFRLTFPCWCDARGTYARHAPD